MQLTRKLASHVQQERHRAEKKLRAPRAPRDLVHAPKRKSSRLEGKPAKNYDESILLKADRSERLPRANNFDLHGKSLTSLPSCLCVCSPKLPIFFIFEPSFVWTC